MYPPNTIFWQLLGGDVCVCLCVKGGRQDLGKLLERFDPQFPSVKMEMIMVPTEQIVIKIKC